MFNSISDLNTYLKFNNYILTSNITLHSNNPVKSFKSFESHFIIIQAAGGIVKNNLNEIIMIYKNKTWDLPKGKVEPNESVKQTAIREVCEETGLQSVSVIDCVCSTFHIYKIKNMRNNNVILKKTTWFLMKNQNPIVDFSPQIEEGIELVTWVPLHSVLSKKTYSSLDEMLRHLVLCHKV